MNTYIEFRIANESSGQLKYTESEIFEKLASGKVTFKIIGDECLMMDTENNNRIMGAFGKSYMR